METKTKYRILGILIILGLVIVLLPLFLNGKEDQQPEVAVIKAPPFPNQSVQISGNMDATNDQPATPPSSDEAVKPSPESVVGADQHSIEPSITDPEQPSEPPKDMVLNKEVEASKNDNKNGDVDNNANLQLDKQLSNKEQAKSASALNVKEPVSLKEKDDAKRDNQIIKPTGKTLVHAKTQVSHKSNQKVSLTNQPLNKNGLIDLKKPAWVIQIGSFKNKTNAIRLVNRLRTNGYKAFVQHVNNSAFGETIRVYVGPEDKQADARSLLGQLEKDLHVAGIVISYKPLSL